MKFHRLTLFITLFLLIFSIPGFTYSKDTHEKLNEEAVNISVLVTENYLDKHLGFSDGIDEEINKKRVWKWIRDGGRTEDEPAWRSKNHFHNPLKPWNEAGLSDIFSGDSSILWAQDVDQEWSWKNAREYYYLALTSETKEEREKNFADMFRSLGQVMHLIEDSSVPAHSRNDTHVLYNYEKWVKGAELGNLLEDPIVFDEEILDIPPNPDAPIPIARIVDTDKYVGANPEVGTGNSIGLSEYANINFLSRDTMFTSDFPHPAKNKVELWTDPANGKRYLRKIDEGEGIEHLAVVRWKYWYRLRHFPKPIKRWLPVALDGKCYEEYTSYLVPRAAGYSAGLLNYFFRGKLRVGINYKRYTTDPEEYGLFVINESDEDMIDGTLTFLYKDKDGKYLVVKDASGRPIIIEDVSITAHQGYRDIIGFVKPQGPVSTYIVVFRGKLGQEEEAVVGKVLDIVEDNCVATWWRDSTYVPGSLESHLTASYQYEKMKDEPDFECEWRIYYTYPEGYNSLSVYCPNDQGTTYNPIEIYEVDPETFDIKTVTWNTQPPLGRLIGVKDFGQKDVPNPYGPEWPQGWRIINITGTRGICLKSIVPSPPPNPDLIRGTHAYVFPLRADPYSIEEGRQHPHLGYPEFDWTTKRWIWHYGPWPPTE